MMGLLGYTHVEVGFLVMSMAANVFFFVAVFMLDQAFSKQCERTRQEQARTEHWIGRYQAERKRSIAQLRRMDSYSGYMESTND